MIQEIIDRLVTGSITNVVKFGSDLPDAPYVVVKPETYNGNRGVRVIAHFTKGADEYEISDTISNPLDDYIYTEVVDLLSDYEFTDHNGLTLVVKDAHEIVDVGVESDDGTVSMEHLFYIPMLQY